MTDQTQERDLRDERKAMRAAIGSRALTAAVLYAPTGREPREHRHPDKHLVPADTD